MDSQRVWGERVSATGNTAAFHEEGGSLVGWKGWVGYDGQAKSVLP